MEKTKDIGGPPPLPSQKKEEIVVNVENVVNNIRRASPVIFAVALICFLLPLVNISCEGRRIAKLTGVDLVAGTEIKIEEKDVFKVEPQIFAILALLSIVVALATSFIKEGKSKIIPAIMALVGFGSLIAQMVRISQKLKEIGEEEKLLLEADYCFAFWLLLFLLLVGFGINVYLYLKRIREK